MMNEIKSATLLGDCQGVGGVPFCRPRAAGLLLNVWPDSDRGPVEEPGGGAKGSHGGLQGQNVTNTRLAPFYPFY